MPCSTPIPSTQSPGTKHVRRDDGEWIEEQRFAKAFRFCDFELACMQTGRKEEAMALLQNHIAVVTGAGSGIGRAIALGYAREGARVVLLDINENSATDAAKEIRGSGGKAESSALDVTRREDCIAIEKQVAETGGQVSILVNNAEINRRNAFTADPAAVLKDWQDIMA